MKADLVKYICALSENSSDVIEEIVGKKYRKFTNFFELVREYGDDIIRLQYNLSDGEILDVTITMKCNVKNDISEIMKSDLEQLGYKVASEIIKRKLHIVLVYDEGRK
jgi:hypothetical protein